MHHRPPQNFGNPPVPVLSPVSIWALASYVQSCEAAKVLMYDTGDARNNNLIIFPLIFQSGSLGLQNSREVFPGIPGERRMEMEP